jgi:hypothetical protein
MEGSMRVKDSSVNISSLCPEILIGLHVLDAIHKKFTGQEIIVTSGNDGQHMANSLHYQNLAADVRTHDLSKPDKLAILTEAKIFLDIDFDIILEYMDLPAEHIHLEFDPH